MDKAIKRAKEKHRNVYAMDDRVFEMLFFLFAAALLCALFELLVLRLSPLLRVLLICAALLSGAAMGLLGVRAIGIRVAPYKREPGFEFIGLHDMSEGRLMGSADVLPRTDEVSHIRDVLETVIFPQSDVKQILCLTGESGCGKSTLLAFLRESCREEYTFLDFSGDYRSLESRIEEHLGSSPQQRIAQMTHAGKVVMILDQFERFFFLPPVKQASVRHTMAQLCLKNTAVIVSMRSEYLADFLKTFDLNDIKHADRSRQKGPKGILRPLMSVIEAPSPALRLAPRNDPSQTIQWQGMRIKRNFDAHLQNAFNPLSTAQLDRMGVTLFYCENQSNASFLDGGISRNSSIMRGKCERVFGEEGASFYLKHSSLPLIAQQIIFHMAEYDQKVRMLAPQELRELQQADAADALDRYFDVQLTSTGDFFTASRILYLLSKARLHQTSISAGEIETGLLAGQFGPGGHAQCAKTLEALRRCQLIRLSERNSLQEYEIAHDYIAQAYLRYCHAGMERGVVSALDNYLTDLLEAKETLKTVAWAQHADHAQRRTFPRLVCYASVLLAMGAYLLERFVYNPWLDFPVFLNPYGSHLPVFFPLITLVSLVYLGQIYDKALKYHAGKASMIVYPPLMLLGAWSQLLYPHMVMIDGICVAIMGLNCALVLDSRYPQASRRDMRMYGFKCAAIGTVFACAHLLFCFFNPDGFPSYIMFVESLMLAVLVLYSHLTHMTKAYLYARAMDVSARRTEKGE